MNLFSDEPILTDMQLLLALSIIPFYLGNVRIE